MKPKFHPSFRRSLPLVIAFCFAAHAHTHAGVINTDAVTGNANIVVDGADTVFANGGTTNIVSINGGVTLTGDAVELDGIRVTSLGGGPQYSILNAGNITVGNSHAVRATGFSTLVENNGLMSNAGGILISTGDNSFLQNTGDVIAAGLAFATGSNTGVNNTATGEIRSTNSDAIFSSTNLNLNNAGVIFSNNVGASGVATTTNSTIINSGSIDGWHAVLSNNSLNLTNQAGGTISGLNHGVLAQGNNLNLINEGGINGNGHAVISLDSATINNSGSLFGSVAAVFTGNELILVNSGGIQSNLTGVSTGNDANISNTGFIGGNDDFGILAADRLTLTNNDDISGGTIGVRAGDSSVINNQAAGDIVGGLTAGLEAGAELELNNAGTIRSTLGTGVIAGNNSTHSNLGIIRGATDGMLLGASNTIQITAVGTIEGENERGIAAADNLTVLNAGSITGATHGIFSTDFLNVNNQTAGSITGGTNGIWTFGGDLLLTNSGVITGTTGAGVLTGERAQINNLNTITGGGNGVDVGSNAEILNAADGEIIGNGGNGIEAGLALTLTNLGLVQGTVQGVNATDDANIENSATILGTANGIVVANTATITNNIAGIITGTNFDGIFTLNELNLSNLGAITGGDIGIVTGNDSLIANTATGSITGTSIFGISAGNALTLTNAGTVFGGQRGVSASNTATIGNTGTIRGLIHGITTGGSATIENDGLIRGIDGKGILLGGSFGTVNNLSGGLITSSNDMAIEGGSNHLIDNRGQIRGETLALNFLDDLTVINRLATATISAENGPAVRSGNNLDFENNGTVSGTDGGIITANNSIILNTFSILGGTGSGVIAENFLELSNFGNISGDSVGVLAEFNADIDNAASIVGGTHGVSFIDSGILTNRVGATITGNNFVGVHTSSFLELLNNGSILGNTTGVSTQNNSVVINNSTITGTTLHGISAASRLSLRNNAQGVIIGDVNGVDALDVADIENRGSIRGVTGAGVSATMESNIANFAFDIAPGVPLIATIEGATDGVRLVDDSQVVNQGVIIGGSTAINLTGAIGSRAINFGTLIGTSGTAISGSTGDDTIALIDNGGTFTGALGSLVTGDILGGGGVNNRLVFDGGLTGIRTSYLDNTSNLIAAADTTENLVQGNILGIHEIHKSGIGIAFVGDGGVDVNGDGITDAIYNITADTITITDGGLYLNANIDPIGALKTTITNSGEALGGLGTWNANITNEVGAGFSPGAIAIHFTNPYFQDNLSIAPVTQGSTNPNDSIGAITVAGNVNFQAGSFYQMDINPYTAASDTLTLTGAGNTLSLANGSVIRISPTDINRTITNGTYVLAATDSAVLGDLSQIGIGVQFNGNVREVPGSFVGTETGDGVLFGSATAFSQNTVLGSYFSTLTLGDGGTDLLLVIQHNYQGLPGLTASQSSLGAAFDVLSNSPDFEIQDFIAAMDYSNLGFVQAVMDALTPEAHLGTTSATMTSNYRLNRMAQNHLSAARNQPASGGEGGVSSTLTGNSSLWGTVSHDWYDAEGFDSHSDTDGDVTAFTVGYDHRINESFLIGGLIDGSTGDYDRRSGGSDVDSFRFAIYGTYGQSLGLYSDFLLGYGSHDLSTTRRTAFGTARGDTDATSLQAMWTVGYTMGDESFKHGPFAGFEFQHFDVDGQTETGGFPNIPVALDGYDVTSFRGFIGYRVEATHGIWRPYASVAYAHEFGDDEIKTSARLGGMMGGTTFTVFGPEQGSAILVGLGTGISFNESLSLDLGYRGEISVDNAVDSHGGSIGLNWKF